MEDKKLHPKTIRIKDALKDMNIPKTIYHNLLCDIDKILIKMTMFDYERLTIGLRYLSIFGGVAGLTYC